MSFKGNISSRFSNNSKTEFSENLEKGILCTGSGYQTRNK